MTTAYGYTDTLIITVEIEAQASEKALRKDAQRGADAAAEALAIMTFSRPITELREEYRRAEEGETNTDGTMTEYGRLIEKLTSIADIAATTGWHNPDDAFVTVDVDER